MSKITLEFTLPEDKQESQQAIHASVAWYAIDEAIAIIRSHRKHANCTLEEALDRVAEELYEARRVVEAW